MAGDIQAVFAAAPFALVVLDRDLRIVAATDRYFEAARRPPEELIGQDIIEAWRSDWSEVNPKTLALLREAAERVVATGRGEDLGVQRFDMGGPDGGGVEVRYWRTSVSPVLGARGEVTHVIVAPEDVTKAARHETTVQLLAEHSPDKISRVDTEGVYRYVSPASETVTGWSAAELKGRPVAELWHPDDRPGIQRIIDTLAAGAEMMTSSFRYRHKEGHYVWLETTSQAIRDSRGQLVEIQSASRDVTERRDMEDRLRRSEALHRSLTANLPDATLVLIDRDYRVLLAEGEMVRQISWADEREWVGTKVTDHRFVPEPLLETALASYRAAFEGRRGEFEAVEGGVTIAVTAVPVPGPDGETEYVLIVARDITQVRAAERQQTALATIGQLALSESDPLMMIPHVTRLVAETLRTDVVNVLELTTGGDLALAGLVGLDIPEDTRFPLASGSQLSAGLAADEPVTIEDLRKERRFAPEARLVAALLVSGVMVPIRIGADRFGILGVYSLEPRNFTPDECKFLQAVATVLAAAFARHRELEASQHAALHDSLTGLPNRVLALERLAGALARRSREGTAVGVLVLDVDRFKVINDSLGHAAGDQLLVELSLRLREAMRATDTVARLGGDEFAVVCEAGSDAREVIAVAERVLGSLARPFSLSSGEHYMSSSIGIAIAARAQDTASSLLRDADAAMYRAKGRGRGRYEVFDDDMRTQVLERLRVESDLRRAIHHGELCVHYQPIVDVASGRPLGAEALVRWQHPERGLLPPAAFIEVAEETGLIAKLGQHVLDEACRDAAAWQREHQIDLTISINVSGRQLSDALFPAKAGETARRHGLRSGTVQLEVTESTLMVEAGSAMTVLDRIREHGLRLVLDDFGTGFSSLAYLKSFPLDGLKLDRSCLHDLEGDGRGAAVIRAVVEMSSELGMSVVAEGIESSAQTEQLRHLGCTLGQGFLYAQPMNLAAMGAFLSDRLGASKGG